MAHDSTIHKLGPIPTEGELTLSVVLFNSEGRSLRTFETDVPAAIAEKVFEATVLNNIPDEVKHFTEQPEDEVECFYCGAPAAGNHDRACPEVKRG